MKLKLLCILLILTTANWAAPSQKAEQLYLQAKKLSFYQKYDQAAQQFQQLLHEYPETPYQAEALFWVAFCHEKAGEKEAAFAAFAQVVEKFPTSPWAEDALDYQINIAAELMTPDDAFAKFLRQLTKSGDAKIQYKAAAELLKNNDYSVIPLLQDLRAEIDFDPEVLTLLDEAQNLNGEQLQVNVDVAENSGNSRTVTHKTNMQNERVNYFAEQRFQQYQQITNAQGNFSDPELILFAMWHILPTEKFADLMNLAKDAQTAWILAYWQRNDPTPFSTQNEAWDEFLRRIHYSRDNYHYAEQSAEENYAPWDARGEIYIKMGQPAIRKKSGDGETWYYPNENRLTFFIRPHITNIFGRAIYIASLDGVDAYQPSSAAAWREIRAYHNEYIFKPYFKFSLAPYYALIENLTIKIIDQQPQQIVFRYEMAAKDFQLKEVDGLFHLGYRERYIVLDADMHNVAEKTSNKQITRPTRHDFDKMWQIGQNIRFSLPPGDYQLCLQIEDVNSDKIGITKMNFQLGAD